MKYLTLVLDGAGTNGKTSHVVDDVVEEIFTGLNSEAEWIEWEASVMTVGGPTPWNLASNRAVVSTARRIEETTEQIILLGFSAGCRPVREFLEAYPHLRHRIAAVGQLADPYQPRGRQQYGVWEPPHRFGIMGQKIGPLGDRTFWCGHPSDPIPWAAWDSLLRYGTAPVDAVPGRFISTFADKARLGRLQLAPFLGLPFHEWFGGLGTRIRLSVDEARSYLGSGHTKAYTVPYPTRDPVTGETDERPLAARLGGTIVYAVKKREGGKA